MWAEEKKTGTLELLLTLPVSMGDVVLGKFLSAWTMIAVSLALTFPMWITVNVLGTPDNGVILAGYLGSLLMAGAYLSVSACISAVTRNQVIAFVVAVSLCFAFLLLGFPLILDFFRPWMPAGILSLLASLGFLQHFQSIVRGVLDARDIIYFSTFTALWLYIGAWVVDHRRS